MHVVAVITGDIMSTEFQIHIDERWSSEINDLRNTLTEETGLIRFDNSFYRICQPASPEPVEIRVFPGHGKANEGVMLEMDPATLYINKVAGRNVMRYPSNFDLVTRDARGIDAALRDVPGMTNVKERFPLEMLIVFCVAESLRFDTISRRVDEVIKYTNGWLVSPADAKAKEEAKRLQTGPLQPLYKNWEDASEAIFRSVSPKAEKILASSRAQLSQEERRHYERVVLQPRDLRFTEAVRSLAVLQRPPVSEPASPSKRLAPHGRR